MPKNEEFYGMSILYLKKILLLKKKKEPEKSVNSFWGELGEVQEVALLKCYSLSREGCEA